MVDLLFYQHVRLLKVRTFPQISIQKLTIIFGAGNLGTPDEVMNIASAMIFAGFKGVVGTLWSIDDIDGPNVSEAFYTHLFQNQHINTRDAAMALHFAVRKLRDDNVPFLRWVPFVHLGA
jgi:CHAT domain-containing protein